MNVVRKILTVGMLAFVLFSIGGCGALTGLPGHGGGKRFAVEQELVSAATRGAIRQIDISALKGRKISLFVNAIGDTGAGNLFGGRYSIISQLRGDYVQTPPTVETARFPRYTSTSTSSISSSIQNSTDTVLPSAERRETQQKGSGSLVQVGME